MIPMPTKSKPKEALGFVAKTTNQYIPNTIHVIEAMIPLQVRSLLSSYIIEKKTQTKRIITISIETKRSDGKLIF